ncbi:hypothetical protein [Pontibacter mangrovi]|uniref:Uncharacterized protein n=1 Tax=Pontibacter mangrovi TaxID=2589816 RepID=A0A501W2A9_9BACT|nr:hypothetical protein [Pontibacter mangrovi]TPE42892.1 hypothetical protein FJM65_16335 [Pontibacter mangrovi]
MKTADNFETRFPSDVYGIVPKTLVVAALVFAFTESWLIKIAVGVPAGLLLHIIPNSYDCKVFLNGSMLSFQFFRPWFRKEVIDLTEIDRAVVEPERTEQTLKDFWWRSDMLWPVGNSKLMLYRNGYLVQTINFRTNPEDTRKLADLISHQIPSEIPTVHP